LTGKSCHGSLQCPAQERLSIKILAIYETDGALSPASALAARRSAHKQVEQRKASALRQAICLLGASSVGAFIATVARADEAPAASAPANSHFGQLLSDYNLAISGYVDASYLALVPSDAGIVEQLAYHELGADSNSLALTQASLTVAMQPGSGLGGLVGLMAGRDVEYLPARFADQFALEQAFGQYVTGTWTFQGGKFVTLAGAEDIAPTGNTNTSRSLLFFAEPLTHTGVRITEAVSEQLSLIVGLNNGWAKCERNDGFACGTGKTGELAAIFTPNKELSLSVQGYYGTEFFTPTGSYAGELRANRFLIDGVATYNATSSLTLSANLDYGSQANFDGDDHTASYVGSALYLNFAFNDKWRASLRGEYVDDRDSHFFTVAANSVMCTNAQTTDFCRYRSNRVSEATLTIAYDPAKQLELRLEGRVDAASNRVFNTGANAPLGGTQSTFSAEALYRFGN